MNSDKKTRLTSGLKLKNMVIIPPIVVIIFGELLLFSGQIDEGVIVHIINLNALIIFMISMKGEDVVEKQLIQSLLLLIQLRIINVAMPLFFTITLYWYPLIYTPMFIPIYVLLRHQGFTQREIGFTTRNLHIYLPVAVLIGFAVAWIEYQIIQPSYLIPNLKISNLIVLTIIMVVFVGSVEELIFRSILLTRFEEAVGIWRGLFVASFLFGIMHSGYGSMYEIFYIILVGLLLGYLFQRTRSLPFLITIHGSVNIFLFGLIPHLII
ncbi:MAG: CPBP family intramembrane glutamic endopeptidase [Halobacteriota archaeon]|nr:CPBP family intramembrane glutamic endopeptidase [Halobacteriota archaeon]